ncbi:adenosine kinase-like [Oppia nitens]|uniref:adenosine kinase-like n=1 Tax=Oppia nitens TaxID=1686743 RepID=UPI0023D9C029|nr:adenosine kinase-like [Oppia nitens]
MIKTSENQILFMGNALLDISAKCDQKLLDKYKLKVDDNCEAEDWQLPIFDKLLLMPNAITTPGGSAQNSARIAQQILTKQTGPESVYFVGSVGNDKTGKILESSVRSSKVRTLYHYHPTLPTGVSAGMVTSETNRTLMANIGASAQMPTEFLDSSLVKKALNKSVVYFVESYFVTHSPILVLSLAKISEQLNKNLFLSLSANYVVTNHFEELMHLMPYTDAVFANSSEAQTFYTHLTGNKIADMYTIATSIAKLDKCKQTNHFWTDIKRCVFITRGSESVIVAKYFANNEIIVKEYSVPKIDVIGDTIGAGDAFVGGIVAHLVTGHNIDDSVHFGIQIASKVCQQRGCVLVDNDF